MLLGSKYLSLLVLSWLITFQLIGVNGVIDPITGSLVIGTVIAGYFFKDNIPFFSKCPKTFDLQELEKDMNNKVFGQHLASKIILSALKGNSNRIKYNKKPLVMTFHGWTGSGKNFISELIASHMFRDNKVKKLRYYLINSHSDFPLGTETTAFKYIPIGVLDIIIPILENHDTSIDSRNSIFIFLTNAGADAIVEKTLDHWRKGYARNQLTIQDFDKILQVSAFNEIGGLKKSHLIDSHIIDHYIPFLPLEKNHVLQCIHAELRQLNQSMDSDNINKILQMIPFGPKPETLFSTSGCKRINALVTTHLN
ncbi:torsin-1A isoform X2 [Sipha flava]|uniref:Torsin-1A isoform X2 n=1 Tax=Sipha flava TaxID=143950 RepID=A0A8B8FGE7_9HEMI|nr:torsin-1A isoform X2 [Sipha flava]